MNLAVVEWWLAHQTSEPPPIPTRTDACSIRYHFQGLTMRTQAIGPIPWWPAGLTSPIFRDELDAMLDQLVEAGDSHCQIDVKWDYGEPGQPYGTGRAVPPCDLTNDLDTYVAICDKVIFRGLKPIFMLPADADRGGIPWLYANMGRVVDALRTGYNRLAYGPLWFGYDGTWPAAWSADDVILTLPWGRQIAGPDAYLGMMFGSGPAGNPYLYVVDEGDYAKPWMQCLDIVMTSTSPGQVDCPSLVNYGQYMLGPALQPHGTCTPDWHAPLWLLRPGTPRGPYFWGVIEWDAFRFVRGNVSGAEIQTARSRQQAIGCSLWG